VVGNVTITGRLVLFPVKLEETVGGSQHFTDQYETMKFFSNHSNINFDLESMINDVLSKITT